MQKLIVLSDLWGKSNNKWTENYLHILRETYCVQYYDCRELAGINSAESDMEAVHRQFLNFGIERAVGQLVNLEPDMVDVLAFSIGGTLAWKAALKGLKIRHLVAVSSTRLRYETQKPECDVDLLYGAKDIYRPTKDWFEVMRLNEVILENEEHDFYRKESLVEKICGLFSL